LLNYNLIRTNFGVFSFSFVSHTKFASVSFAEAANLAREGCTALAISAKSEATLNEDVPVNPLSYLVLKNDIEGEGSLLKGTYV
jgi:hypothetical protein